MPPPPAGGRRSGVLGGGVAGSLWASADENAPAQVLVTCGFVFMTRLCPLSLRSVPGRSAVVEQKSPCHARTDTQMHRRRRGWLQAPALGSRRCPRLVHGTSPALSWPRALSRGSSTHYVESLHLRISQVTEQAVGRVGGGRRSGRNKSRLTTPCAAKVTVPTARSGALGSGSHLFLVGIFLSFCHTWMLHFVLPRERRAVRVLLRGGAAAAAATLSPRRPHTVLMFPSFCE